MAWDDRCKYTVSSGRRMAFKHACIYKKAPLQCLYSTILSICFWLMLHIVWNRVGYFQVLHETVDITINLYVNDTWMLFMIIKMTCFFIYWNVGSDMNDLKQWISTFFFFLLHCSLQYLKATPRSQFMKSILELGITWKMYIRYKKITKSKEISWFLVV